MGIKPRGTMSKDFYINKREVWDAKKCAKHAKSNPKDHWGNGHPYKGHYFGKSGPTRYNGGCIREDKWYQGELHSLPKVHKSYEWLYVETWGYRLAKKGAKV